MSNPDNVTTKLILIIYFQFIPQERRMWAARGPQYHTRPQPGAPYTHSTVPVQSLKKKKNFNVGGLFFSKGVYNSKKLTGYHDFNTR